MADPPDQVWHPPSRARLPCSHSRRNSCPFKWGNTLCSERAGAVRRRSGKQVRLKMNSGCLVLCMVVPFWSFLASSLLVRGSRLRIVAMWAAMAEAIDLFLSMDLARSLLTVSEPTRRAGERSKSARSWSTALTVSSFLRMYCSIHQENIDQAEPVGMNLFMRSEYCRSRAEEGREQSLPDQLLFDNALPHDAKSLFSTRHSDSLRGLYSRITETVQNVLPDIDLHQVELRSSKAFAKAMAALQERIAFLEAQLARVNQRSSSLQQQVVSLEFRREEAVQRASCTIRHENEQLKSLLEVRTMEVRQLQASLKDKDQEIAKARADFRAELRGEQTLQAELRHEMAVHKARSEEEVAGLRRQAELLSSKVVSLEGSKMAISAQGRQLNEQVRQADLRSAALLRQVQSLTARLEESAGEVCRLKRASREAQSRHRLLLDVERRAQAAAQSRLSLAGGAVGSFLGSFQARSRVRARAEIEKQISSLEAQREGAAGQLLEASRGGEESVRASKARLQERLRTNELGRLREELSLAPK